MAVLSLGRRGNAGLGAEPGARRLGLVACLLLIAGASVGDVITTRDIAFGGVEVLVVACAALLLSTPQLAGIAAAAWVGEAAGIAAGGVSLEAAAIDSLSVAMAAALIALLARSRDHRRARAAVTARVPIADTATLPLLGAAVSAGALRDHGLTPRECEVVALALSGLTAVQIGTRLFIGRRTVETHLARAYSKFGVHSRAGIAEKLFPAENRAAR